MPKKGHSEEQIIAALKQHESGEKTANICRRLGISQATFYLWKKQYAGLGVQELREMRQLREENTRLKRLVGVAWSTLRYRKRKGLQEPLQNRFARACGHTCTLRLSAAHRLAPA